MSVKPEKGLLVAVYRRGNRRTYNADQGIPADHDSVLLLVEGGIYTPEQVPDVIPVVIIDRPIYGAYAVPASWVDDELKPLKWPMAGGTYLGCSDSRVAKAIGFYGAIPLHDRHEG